jgi:hypothetical protein
MLRERHVQNANLGRYLRAACSPQGISQELVAKADAQKRSPHAPDPSANGALFFDHPGTRIRVPDIHRSTHDPQRVIWFQRWYGFDAIQRDGIPCDALFLQVGSQSPWMFAVDVLED